MTAIFVFIIFLIHFLTFSQKNFSVFAKEIKFPVNFDTGIEYVFCQEGKIQASGGRKKLSTSGVVLIRKDFNCHALINRIIFDDSSGSQVFYIQPKNSTNFFSTLSVIQKVLHENQPIRTFREPVFIIHWPDVLKSETESEDLIKNISNSRFDNNSTFSVSVTNLVFFQVSWASVENSLPDIQIDLWEIYWIENKIPVTNKLNTLIVNGTLNVLELFQINPRRGNLNGLNLRVLAKGDIGNEGETKLVKHANGTPELISGLTVSVLRDFQAMLNFTVTAVQGGGSIRESNDGGLTGLGKQIIDREADLSIAMGNNLPYRRKWLDFLPPLMRDRACTFFMQPPSHVSRNIFTSPFDQDLWLVVFSTFAILVTSSLLLKYICENEKYTTGGEMVLWTIATICQQGWYQRPKTLPVKIFFLVGSLAWMIIFIAYSGSIVAMLSQKEKPIKDYNDLVDYGFTLIGNISTSYNHVLSTDKTEELERRASKIVTTMNDSIQKVFQHNSKIATTLNLNEFYTLARNFGHNESTLCDIELFKASPPTTRTGMFLRRGSHLKEFFYLKTMVLRERGFSGRYRKQYFSTISPACDRNEVKSLETLEIADIQFVLLIFGSGFFLSFLVFLFEIFNRFIIKVV